MKKLKMVKWLVILMVVLTTVLRIIIGVDVGDVMDDVTDVIGIDTTEFIENVDNKKNTTVIQIPEEVQFIEISTDKSIIINYEDDYLTIDID